MAQFTLLWDAYKQNICRGLSLLQQNSEFVDMTIAADGHHVKVHQMILSLCSPYIKELIISANSSHPIIFLNKVSYSTLCALLEYIYTGEVVIANENIADFIQAGQELHIQGLKDMTLTLSSTDGSLCIRNNQNEEELLKSPDLTYLDQTDINTVNETETQKSQETSILINADASYLDDDINYQPDTIQTDIINSLHRPNISKNDKDSQIQYTLSNQGSIQLVLNRFIYNLRYTSRKGFKKGHRHWRCVDNLDRLKCPASVVTKGDVVIKRYSAHNHPFHDKKILKKVQNEAIYSAIHEAEALGNNMKLKRQQENLMKQQLTENCDL